MLLESFILLGLSAGSISFWYFMRDLYLKEKKKIINFNTEIPPEYNEIVDLNEQQNLIQQPPSYN